MTTVFDTAATVRAQAGLEPITRSGLDAALAQLETKLTWRLVYVAAVVVAAIKLIPNLY